MKVKSESEVTESCPTLSDPTDCSLPGSSIHGIFQARVLEWGEAEATWADMLAWKRWMELDEFEGLARYRDGMTLGELFFFFHVLFACFRQALG